MKRRRLQSDIIPSPVTPHCIGNGLIDEILIGRLDNKVTGVAGAHARVMWWADAIDNHTTAIHEVGLVGLTHQGPNVGRYGPGLSFAVLAP